MGIANYKIKVCVLCRPYIQHGDMGTVNIDVETKYQALCNIDILDILIFWPPFPFRLVMDRA